MLPNLTPDIELADRLFGSLLDATHDGVGSPREA